MDTVKNVVDGVSSKGSELLHGGAKEAEKTRAKDSDAPVGDRVTAAKDAVVDSAKEVSSATCPTGSYST